MIDKPLSYRDAGVDIDAGNQLVDRIKPAVARTHRPEVLTGLGGFGGLFHLGKRFEDPVLVSGTDGVGTKLLLARRMGRHDTIGIDLVAMCVNDILVCGAEPLFFLDYFACGQLDVDAASEIIGGIAEGCRQAGCALIGGETAEMPGMYAPGEYDLAGFAVGAVERNRIIDGSEIDDSCVLIGLASSGPHSNGYSLIRQVLERSGQQPDDPFDGATVGERLLAPTRIYTAAVTRAVATGKVRGMAHITGGGLVENIVRVVPEHLGIEIDTSSWQPPPIFGWLADGGRIELHEMHRTFNMGIGYVLIAAERDLDLIGASCQEPVHIIGRVVAGNGDDRVQLLDG